MSLSTPWIFYFGWPSSAPNSCVNIRGGPNGSTDISWVNIKKRDMAEDKMVPDIIGQKQKSNNLP